MTQPTLVSVSLQPEIWFCNTHSHCHCVAPGHPVIFFFLINSSIWPKQHSASCNVLTASVVLISLSVCVCVCVCVCACVCVLARRLSCLFQSRGAFEGLVWIKSGSGTLRIKKKKTTHRKRTAAFYAGQKSRQSGNETHKRLRGNLGTKQLDDTPYAPWPTTHH